MARKVGLSGLRTEGMGQEPAVGYLSCCYLQPIQSPIPFPCHAGIGGYQWILHFDPWLLLPLTLLLAFVLSFCTKEAIYEYSGMQQQALGREVIQSLEGC